MDLISFSLSLLNAYRCVSVSMYGKTGLFFSANRSQATRKGGKGEWTGVSTLLIGQTVDIRQKTRVCRSR